MKKTIRELGGDVWAELHRIPEPELDWKTRERIVDIVMGVLARHTDLEVRNDEDLPVSPLERPPS